MGIHQQMATFIVKEHKYRPIEGAALLIGRQTVYLTPDACLELFRKEGVVCYSIPASLDTNTRADARKGYISDTSFFT
jgi:hypothetical protein